MNTEIPSRHERRRMRTRQILSDTTLSLVLEKGYENVSIQEITDQSDLGRGTFYIHFKDKEDVLWSMFRKIVEELEQNSHNQLDRTSSQVEYFGLLNIFQHADSNRDLYRMIFAGHGPAGLTAKAQSLFAETIRFDIEQSQPVTSVDFHLPVEFEAQMLTGMITRLLAWWLESPNTYSAGQMAEMTYKAIYRLSPPGTP
jgi:AcrR family transcriptional regulator